MNPDNIIVKLPEPSVFSEWVAVSQIVANVAVIVAIVVAVMQWRSTHSSASSTAEQFHTQAMKDFWMTLAADADLAYLYRVGRQTPEKLNEKEKVRFFYAGITWFSLQEFMFAQATEGRVSEKFYKEWKGAVADDMKDAGFQEIWELERDFFDHDFRSFIDRMIQ